MKISFVTNCLASGGSERVLSILANSLSDRGHDVEVLAMHTPTVFYKLRPEVRYIFAGEACRSASIAKRFWWLRKHLKDNRPDVIVAFMNRVYCATLLSTIGLHIPVITSERNDPEYSAFYVKCLIKVLLPLTTHHVVQTEDIKAYYSKRIQRKTSIIVNPVNDGVFDLPNNIKKKDVIVSVGRLDPQKNQRMMISAFARVAYKYPTWRLVIYGEGPIRQELEALVAERNLSGRVLLPGRTEDVFRRMKEAKVFCLSSNYEGMSNALIEAICLGMPIVTTLVSGVKELIKDGQNGIVTSVGNEKEFAMALDRLIGDEALQAEFANESIKQVHLFERENIVNQWEGLIETIVKQNKHE